jgi:hypothetical protein
MTLADANALACTLNTLCVEYPFTGFEVIDEALGGLSLMGPGGPYGVYRNPNGALWSAYEAVMDPEDGPQKYYVGPNDV